MKLTKLETEILLHRLGVLDAISDVYCDSMLPEDASEQEKEDACESVCNAVESLETQVRANVLPDTLGAGSVEAWVLEDCIDGSTWMGCAESACNDGEMTEQQVGRHYSAGVKLAAKVSQIIGKECRFPRS